MLHLYPSDPCYYKIMNEHLIGELFVTYKVTYKSACQMIKSK